VEDSIQRAPCRTRLESTHHLAVNDRVRIRQRGCIRSLLQDDLPFGRCHYFRPRECSTPFAFVGRCILFALGVAVFSAVSAVFGAWTFQACFVTEDSHRVRDPRHLSSALLPCLAARDRDPAAASICSAASPSDALRVRIAAVSAVVLLTVGIKNLRYHTEALRAPDICRYI